MILLLDSNEFRRRSIFLSLYSKKFIVSEQPICDAEFITKPFMTVYLNPSTTQLAKIKNEDTICVIAKNDLGGNIPSWMRVIPLDNTTTNHIIKLYEELCPYNRGREVFGILGMEDNKITLGGAYIDLSLRQRKLVRFLAYNAGKQFRLFEICSYFDYKSIEEEESFDKMIVLINRKCAKIFREPLISRDNDRYRINPSVINY